MHAKDVTQETMRNFRVFKNPSGLTRAAKKTEQNNLEFLFDDNPFFLR